MATAYGGDPEQGLEVLDNLHPADFAPTDAAWLAYTRGDALHLAHAGDGTAEFLEAIELGERVGNWFVVSVARRSLATQLAHAGDTQGSLDAYAAALHSYLRHGNLTHAVTAIRNLLGLLADLGDDHGVALLAGAASRGDLRPAMPSATRPSRSTPPRRSPWAGSGSSSTGPGSTRVASSTSGPQCSPPSKQSNGSAHPRRTFRPPSTRSTRDRLKRVADERLVEVGAFAVRAEDGDQLDRAVDRAEPVRRRPC